MFNKLGEKGWKSLIPIYNNWVYLKLGDLPGWLILLPIANAIGLIVASFNIPKKLNKSTALGILYLISPNIYYLVLILGKTPSKSETNNIIENNISNIDDEILYNKMRKIIDKMKNNKKYSSSELKSKIYNHLISSGYSKEKVIYILNEYNF